MMNRLALFFLCLVGVTVFAMPISKANSTVSGTMVQKLDGEWQSINDPGDKGKSASWFDPKLFSNTGTRAAQVPGSVTETWDVNQFWSDAPKTIFWYTRTFAFDETPAANTRYYLRFGAVKQT